MQKNVTIFMTPQRLRRFLCAKRAAGDVKKAEEFCRAICKGATECVAGIANAITQIQMAERYRCGISQRRTKILFAGGKTKCGGKRA